MGIKPFQSPFALPALGQAPKCSTPTHPTPIPTSNPDHNPIKHRSCCIVAGKCWFMSLNPEAMWLLASCFSYLGFSLLVIYRPYLFQGWLAHMGMCSLNAWSPYTQWAFCKYCLVGYIRVCQIHRDL